MWVLVCECALEYLWSFCILIYSQRIIMCAHVYVCSEICVIGAISMSLFCQCMRLPLYEIRVGFEYVCVVVCGGVWRWCSGVWRCVVVCGGV